VAPILRRLVATSSLTATLIQPPLPLERQIADVSSWPERDQEPIGSKPKWWLEAPNRVRWLFKEVQANRTVSGDAYLKGDDWAEAVASDVARLLGLPSATVELAVRAGVTGVISRHIAEGIGGGLVHGNEVLAGAHPGYDPQGRGLDSLYTVVNVMRAVGEVAPPASYFGTAASCFAGYLTLDAVVGNTDRHHQNWAFLKGRSGSRLAPTFDHGSSLGFALSDPERRDRLTTKDRNRTVQAYSLRGRVPFADARTPVEAALVALDVIGTQRAEPLLRAVAEVRDHLPDLVACVPHGRMSDAARTFALTLMEGNIERLLREGGFG
jgi:hypothetical protein